MKPLKWPTDKDQHAYMKMRQQQNREKTYPAEEWIKSELKKHTTYKWTQQAQWGYRLFDFWNNIIGCAVEVDGPEHDQAYDSYRDQYNLIKSKIIVLRIRNFNQDDLQKALKTIKNMDTWKARRSLNNSCIDS